MNGVLEGFTEKIREACRREEGIVAAYLFGSAGSGRMRADSDIDVALLLESDREEDFPVLLFAANLERVCERAVDLVVLNRAGELLKHQVRRHGRLIFERDAGKRKQFEVTGRKLFEDFRYLHERYVRKVLYEKSRSGNQ